MISIISNLSTQYIGRSNFYNYGYKKAIDRNYYVPVEPIEEIVPKDKLNIDFNKLEAYKKEKSEKNTNVQENNQLTDKEKKIVEELKKRDADVKRHEQAHVIVGGDLVRGGANYNYTLGPDGKRYAIGGEVNIDIALENEPEKTIKKMQRVVATALAPTDPSPKDYAVANQARRNEAEARKELAVLQKEDSYLTLKKYKKSGYKKIFNIYTKYTKNNTTLTQNLSIKV